MIQLELVKRPHPKCRGTEGDIRLPAWPAQVLSCSSHHTPQSQERATLTELPKFSLPLESPVLGRGAGASLWFHLRTRNLPLACPDLHAILFHPVLCPRESGLGGPFALWFLVGLTQWGIWQETGRREVGELRCLRPCFPFAGPLWVG